VNSSTKDPSDDLRRSIRLVLKIPMTILGKDSHENEFVINVETIDVSTRGFCIELPRECVSTCDDVFISVATKFNARAKVRWLDDEQETTPTVRCGIELMEPFSNWVLTQ
jgi:hypothetical protein